MTTIGQRLYLAQKIRDAENYKSISMHECERKIYPKSKQEQKELKEYSKKMEEGIKAGYESERYDFPEYQWRFQQDGNTYLRSSCNNNVYDISQTRVIVGTWNKVLQRIELNDELTQRIKLLEETVFNLRVRLEELVKE